MDNFDEKYKRRKQRKIISLFFITSLTVVILIVGTYAWFVGTGSIATSSFSVGVSSGDGIELSLDGENWEDESLTLTEEAILGTAASGNKAYTGNTNHWVGTNGLIPVSSDGTIDTDANRLILYGKSSITATAGGFRLISTRIDNYSTTASVLTGEKDGYVAFDLFFRNGTGPDYIATYNQADDEAVYLTTTSAVTVTASGSATEDYGLANSVRIAFAQIGRVKSTGNAASAITGIDCATDTPTAGDTTFVGINTGLCNATGAGTTIWEPNNTLHNSNLITYFGNVCKTKSVSGTPAVISYSTTACTALVNGTDTPTYVVNSNILSTDNVDVYDGNNGFTVPNDYKLTNIDTFTDTDKAIEGQTRPAFFYLAANSITKIRVYIYLEGQDVDNYDLISTTNTISIQFGFTKNQLNTAPTS